jgi:ATP-dependent Clp protease ATP-binding subunit ClpC
VVALAEREARSLDHERVGTEHLLLGLVSPEGGPVAEALRAGGATVTSVRRKVSEAIGPGTAEGAAPRWTARATRALGRAPRFARDRQADLVGAQDVLLAVLDVEGTAGQVLRGLGVDLEALRSGLGDPDGTTADTTATAAATARPPTVPAHCPTCHEPVAGGLQGREVPLRGPVERRAVVVVACPACGTILGIV